MERETSRLALHVQRWDEATEGAVRSLKNSRHIKVMDLGGDDHGYNREDIQDIFRTYKKNNPDATIGYRHYSESTDQKKGEENLSKHNQFTVDAIEATYDYNMEYLVDIIYTPYNEVFPYDGPRFNEYVNALSNMGEQIHSSGFKSAGGNWSVTTPHPIEVWGKIAPAMKYLDYVVLHGYSKPTLLEKEKELYPHESAIAWLKDNGIEIPQFILGEFGVDHALYTSPPDFSGWQRNMSEDQFASQLEHSNERLAQSKYLYVACVFGAGVKSPWESYGYSKNRRVIQAIDSLPKTLLTSKDYLDSVGEVMGDLVNHLSGNQHREWIPAGLIKVFTEWRNTDGNEWEVNTEDEAWAFHEHTIQLDMPKGLIVKMSASIEIMYGRKAHVPIGEDFAISKEKVPHPSSVMHMTTEDSKVMPDITIETASSITGIDRDTLEAFLLVESQGKRVDEMGYPTCRFEVAQWAKRNPSGWKEASKYFDGEESWGGNDDFVNLNGTWEAIHSGQPFRRSVIAFASTFGERDQAYACSSWGVAQIMGWHYEVLGYKSAMEMSQSFVCWDKQMLAFITILGYLGCSHALREGDIRGAIKMYNGSGQVNEYLKRFNEALNKIKQGEE